MKVLLAYLPVAGANGALARPRGREMRSCNFTQIWYNCGEQRRSSGANKEGGFFYEESPCIGARARACARVRILRNGRGRKAFDRHSRPGDDARLGGRRGLLCRAGRRRTGPELRDAHFLHGGRDVQPDRTAHFHGREGHRRVAAVHRRGSGGGNGPGTGHHHLQLRYDHRCG